MKNHEDDVVSKVYCRKHSNIISDLSIPFIRTSCCSLLYTKNRRSNHPYHPFSCWHSTYVDNPGFVFQKFLTKNVSPVVLLRKKLKTHVKPVDKRNGQYLLSCYIRNLTLSLHNSVRDLFAYLHNIIYWMSCIRTHTSHLNISEEHLASKECRIYVSGLLGANFPEKIRKTQLLIGPKNPRPLAPITIIRHYQSDLICIFIVFFSLILLERIMKVFGY